MKALDTLHMSAVKADNLRPGEEFDAPDDLAKSLEERGLAKRVGGSKSEPAPKNKAELAPENKAAPAPLSAATAPVEAKKRGRPAKQH